MNRFKRIAVSAAVAAGTLVGGAGLAAAPASAATGTTTATVCPASNPAPSNTSVFASWWNGKAWTAAGSVKTSGCASFTLQHSGYYYFSATTYILTPNMCTEYAYRAVTQVYTKQTLPASNVFRPAMALQQTYNFC